MNNGVTFDYDTRPQIFVHRSAGLSISSYTVVNREIKFTFDNPIRAFAVLLHDFGDVKSGTLTLETNTGDPITVLDGANLANNNLYFYGIVNTLAPFTEVTLKDTYDGDSYSIRKMMFGEIDNDEFPFLCSE